MDTLYFLQRQVLPPINSKEYMQIYEKIEKNSKLAQNFKFMMNASSKDDFSKYHMKCLAIAQEEATKTS